MKCVWIPLEYSACVWSYHTILHGHSCADRMPSSPYTFKPNALAAKPDVLCFSIHQIIQYGGHHIWVTYRPAILWIKNAECFLHFSICTPRTEACPGQHMEDQLIHKTEIVWDVLYIIPVYTFPPKVQHDVCGGYTIFTPALWNRLGWKIVNLPSPYEHHIGDSILNSDLFIPVLCLCVLCALYWVFLALLTWDMLNLRWLFPASLFSLFFVCLFYSFFLIWRTGMKGREEREVWDSRYICSH